MIEEVNSWFVLHIKMEKNNLMIKILLAKVIHHF